MTCWFHWVQWLVIQKIYDPLRWATSADKIRLTTLPRSFFVGAEYESLTPLLLLDQFLIFLSHRLGIQTPFGNFSYKIASVCYSRLGGKNAAP
jgi:hypothetical protein